MPRVVDSLPDAVLVRLLDLQAEALRAREFERLSRVRKIAAAARLPRQPVTTRQGEPGQQEAPGVRAPRASTDRDSSQESNGGRYGNHSQQG